MAATTKSRKTAAKTRATPRKAAARSRSPSSAARGRMGGRTGGRGPNSRARRSLLASRPSLRHSAGLESHHVDILALALIAVGIFLGGVAYVGWSGGALGNGAITAVRFLLGALGYAVPAALVVAGALILLRELRPPARPLRTGTICLTIAMTLGLAAGTLGIGPRALSGPAFWHAAGMERRGGIVGQGEYWVASHLISALGADILAVFLLVAGVILVSGAGLAGVLRWTGTGMATTGRALARSTEDLRTSALRRTPADSPTAAPARTGADEAQLEPEEWAGADTTELVGAAHAASPAPAASTRRGPRAATPSPSTPTSTSVPSPSPSRRCCPSPRVIAQARRARLRSTRPTSRRRAATASR